MTNTFSVRESIAKFGTSAIARAMGVGISTVHGWKQADALPGGDRVGGRGLYEQRLKAFREAVQRLSAESRKRTKKRRRPADGARSAA
jgi:hypothetical protein